MNFNNNELTTIEKLIDDRIYFLKESHKKCMTAKHTDLHTEKNEWYLSSSLLSSYS